MRLDRLTQLHALPPCLGEGAVDGLELLSTRRRPPLASACRRVAARVNYLLFQASESFLECVVLIRERRRVHGEDLRRHDGWLAGVRAPLKASTRRVSWQNVCTGTVSITSEQYPVQTSDFWVPVCLRALGSTYT